MDKDDVLRKGWLFKQSRYLKKWKRRFTVLTKTHLATYGSEDTSGSPTEVLLIKRCNAVRSAEDETLKPNSFRVEHEGVAYFFYADTLAEKDGWVNFLSKISSEDHGRADHEEVC